jgi:hypothetical protein
LNSRNNNKNETTTTTTTTRMNGFQTAHERLKHAIHSYWRQNTYLSPRSWVGKVVMSGVYFSIPVVLGYYISIQAVAISESTVEERFLGKRGSDRRHPDVDDAASVVGGSSSDSDHLKLPPPPPPPPLQLGGDKILVKDEVNGTERIERVGAGGWGGGVHLVTSDRDTQDVNRKNLERFLKRQRRLKERKEEQERQQQQQQQ